MGPGPIWGNGFPGFSDELARFIQVVTPLLVLWFVNMGLVGWLAGRKGRETGMWAVIAFFTGPFALIAILLVARRDPIPDSEAERLEAAPINHVRLVSDSKLELDVAGRLAWLGGQLAARINGQPSFRLAGPAEWRWSDGTPMTAEERAQLRHEIPNLGRHEGWVLTMDEDTA